MKYEVVTPSGEVVATANMPEAMLVAETLSVPLGPLGIRYAPSGNPLVPSGAMVNPPLTAAEWSAKVAAARALFS